jgi:hypothetical protein
MHTHTYTQKTGGKSQFPYLVDPNTKVEMYESQDIIQYLTDTYGDGSGVPPIKGGAGTTLSIGLALIPRAGKGSKKTKAAIGECFCVYVYIYVCVCVIPMKCSRYLSRYCHSHSPTYLFTYTHIHTHTHTHTHTNRQSTTQTANYLLGVRSEPFLSPGQGDTKRARTAPPAKIMYVCVCVCVCVCVSVLL